MPDASIPAKWPIAASLIQGTERDSRSRFMRGSPCGSARRRCGQDVPTPGGAHPQRRCRRLWTVMVIKYEPTAGCKGPCGRPTERGLGRRLTEASM